MESQPTILFFNNFVPSNINGGTVLIRRLLSGYPREKLIALTNAVNSIGPIDPPWCRRHVEFPAVKDYGSRAIWRFKGLINRAKGLMNWMMLPVVAFYATRLMRQYSVSAIVSVAAGTYFLPAAMAARWAKVPWVLIVHDDWVPIVAPSVPGPPWVFRIMFRWAVRRADHIFAVSEGMREKLKAEFGVESEVQMPATEPWDLAPEPAIESGGPLRVLYTGNGWAAQDSLDLLIRLVREKTFRSCGVETVELHLCAPWKIEPDPDIRQHGWVSESDVRKLIAASDVLFLPYSFTAEDRPFTRTSFPAKAADYIASGKTILILGPKDSTICRYAEEFRCAEVVTELSGESVAKAICRLASGEEYRRSLASNARRAFALNHDISRQRDRFFGVIARLVNDRRK